MSHRGRKNADDALALALASGRSCREAAALAGVAERTVGRRLADPRFKARVAEMRAAMVERALGQMADAMSEAAARLRELLRAQGEAVCLSAARALLGLTIRLRELVELEERLQALESKLAETNG